jgi:hypothetical protein
VTPGARRVVSCVGLVLCGVVILWVNVLDSGRSGAGGLLAGGPAAGAATHIYGSKTAPARMLFEGLSYLAMLALGLAAVLAAVERAQRVVAAAGIAGVAISLHSVAMLVMDRRPTWLVDLVATLLALVGCSLAAGFAMSRSRGAGR